MPNTFQSIHISLGCPPDVEGNFLLLGNHSFQTQAQEIPELDMTLLPCGLCFTVPEGNIQTLKAVKKSMALFSYDAYDPQKCPS